LLQIAHGQNLQHAVRIGPRLPAQPFEAAGRDRAHNRIVIAQKADQMVYGHGITELPQSLGGGRPSQGRRILQHFYQRLDRAPVLEPHERLGGRATHGGVFVIEGENERADGLIVARISQALHHGQPAFGVAHAQLLILPPEHALVFTPATGTGLRR
jgi:hypothetical protein